MQPPPLDAQARERVAWLNYLRLHEQLLRQQLAAVPFNCELRETFSRMLELNIETYVEAFNAPH